MGEIKVYQLTDQARQFMLGESSCKSPDETGGMLIGKFDGDCVWIQYATGPGPMAKHSPQRFQRDGDYSQKVLDSIVMESDGEYDYIGEWHSHPVKSGPSPLDVAAMRWIASTPKYATDTPILGLCTNEAYDTWRLSFYRFDGGQLLELKPPR